MTKETAPGRGPFFRSCILVPPSMTRRSIDVRRETGRIVSIEGSTITLDGKLHASQMVRVTGTRSGDRNIDAQTVTVMPH